MNLDVTLDFFLPFPVNTFNLWENMVSIDACLSTCSSVTFSYVFECTIGRELLHKSKLESTVNVLRMVMCDNYCFAFENVNLSEKVNEDPTTHFLIFCTVTE